MLPIPKLAYTIFCKPVKFSELTSLINYWSSLPHQTTKYLKYLVKFGLLALAGRAGQQTTTPSTQPGISPVVTPAVGSCCPAPDLRHCEPLRILKPCHCASFACQTLLSAEWTITQNLTTCLHIFWWIWHSFNNLASENNHSGLHPAQTAAAQSFCSEQLINLDFN